MIQDFTLPSGERLKIETLPGDGGFQQNAAPPEIDLATALRPLRELCEVVLERVAGLSSEPDSVELSIGVTLSAEGSLIIAKGKAEANLAVKISFKKAEK